MRTNFLPAWFFRLPLIAAGLCAAATLPLAPVHAQMYKGTQLVKAELLADTTAVTPGKPFTAGLRLRMAPHWHTYWQNSGDAGLPTKIDWQLPAGFKAGPILWPLPTRIDSAGDIVNYGYSEEVTLLTEITPPATLPPGGVAIKAKAVWLVCADLCVPGDANLALNLPAAADGGTAPAPANGPVFAEARALLPRPANDDTITYDPAKRKMEGDDLVGRNLHFVVGVARIDGKDYETEFFPLPPDDVEVGHPRIRGFSSGQGPISENIWVPITTNPAGADRVGGVLVLTGPDGARIAYSIPGKDAAVPVAPAATPAAPSQPASPGTGSGAASQPPSAPPAGNGSGSPPGSASKDAGTSNSDASAKNATSSAPAASLVPGVASTAPASALVIAAPATVVASATPAAPTVPAGSLWHFLLLGFLGGLILNVMPCVLPVISLKLFSFVKQANEAPERVFKLGLAYAAGVFAWFLGFAALVVALRSAGREVGYSFHLQNPWFIVGLCAAVFVFSLNLLGVFEFILPGVFGSALGGASQRNEGYAGAFFQGLLATVLGSACTAPLFGAALGFAFSQNAPVVFAMFAAIAAGMSSPFILLAARPGWLRFLPRPGAWMERVKQATGFLMLATVLWLLSILGSMRGADAVVWMGSLLLVLGVACWLQGTFNTLVAPAGTRAAAVFGMLVLLVGGGWFGVRQIADSRRPAAAFSLETIADGGSGSGNGSDAALLTGTGASAGSLADGTTGALGAGSREATFSDSLQAALRTGQPVFVDFTASWCVNCKVNERVVLSTDAVQAALRRSNARFLTADWTDGAADITALLKKFGRAGVPLYVIYPADHSREPIVLPELLTSQLVVDGLRSAAAPAAPNPAASSAATGSDATAPGPGGADARTLAANPRQPAPSE